MKNDGGHAFPLKDASYGMTLHQYFAGQALLGMLAGNTRINGCVPNSGETELPPIALLLADGMIAEYERRKAESKE